jgi:NAD+ synthase
MAIARMRDPCLAFADRLAAARKSAALISVRAIATPAISSFPESMLTASIHRTGRKGIPLGESRTLGRWYNLLSLVARSPEGEQKTVRLPLRAYQGIVAATNMMQRMCKQIEYYHADRLNYPVAGTPNRLEYDQGFFVKNGDCSADVKPIAHLYKSQVYQLAEYLGVPEEIRRRPPTTDTYSLPQTQEEFYFSLPYDRMDLSLYGLNHAVPAEEAAAAAQLTTEQAHRVWADIAAKRRATRYLHLPPLLIEKVEEVAGR